MQLHILYFFVLLRDLVTPSLACKCWHFNGSGHTNVGWDESYSCCSGDAMGVWISKDCKHPIGRVFTACCRTYGLQGDC